MLMSFVMLVCIWREYFKSNKVMLNQTVVKINLVVKSIQKTRFLQSDLKEFGFFVCCLLEIDYITAH